MNLLALRLSSTMSMIGLGLIIIDLGESSQDLLNMFIAMGLSCIAILLIIQ
jgi:hypothetical protein